MVYGLFDGVNTNRTAQIRSESIYCGTVFKLRAVKTVSDLTRAYEFPQQPNTTTQIEKRTSSLQVRHYYIL